MNINRSSISHNKKTEHRDLNEKKPMKLWDESDE